MAQLRDKDQRDFRLVKSEEKTSQDFNMIKVGKGLLRDDVVKLLGTADEKKLFGVKVERDKIVKAIKNQNLKELRSYSEFFYNSNGIYSRLCRYMAYIYKYD